MISNISLKAILDHLAAQLKVELDPSGTTMLPIDGLVLTLMADDQQGLTVLTGLGAVVGPLRPMVMMRMLQANHGWSLTRGATLALGPDGLQAVLMARWSSGAQPDRVAEGLGHFLDAAEQWQAVLAKAAESEGAASDAIALPGATGEIFTRV